MIALVLVAVIAPVWASTETGFPAGGTTIGGILAVTDLTSHLGATFHPGAIQGFGANASTIYLAGIGEWDRPVDVTQPVLAEMSTSEQVVNRTPEVASLFTNGGVFGTVWNGSTWWISGEATWGTLGEGVIISGSDAGWTNLTPQFGPYFHDQGAWAVGWNGSAWLVAGNSTAQAVLLSYEGGVIRNLTGLLPNNRPGDWIQLMVWNGQSWLLGGRGVFGLLTGQSYVDLLPASPFTSGGPFAADWNGSAWLVGGGPPAATDVVRGTTQSPGPALPTGFSVWVNAIVWTGAGWLVAGKGGATGSATSTSELAFWPANSSGSGAVDLSYRLPPSFADGQVQYAAWAPPLGRHAILLVGQGALDPQSGFSLGAIALLQLS